MRNRSEYNNPRADLIRSQREEIENYKWIESEKRGHDIGWKHAVTEWHDRHYGQWKEHVSRTSLDERRNTDDVPNVVASNAAAKKRRRAFSVEHRENLGLAMRAWHEKRKSGGFGSI